jgi:uncharacterized protein (TIRG00374 family)
VHLATDPTGEDNVGRFSRAGDPSLPAVRTLLVVAGLVVSATFAYLAVRNAELDETVEALRATSLPLLVPALGLLTLAFLIRAVRWRSLFAKSARPPLPPLVGAQFVGYLANAILPVRAGDAVAIVSLNRRAKTPLAEGTATMFVARAEDVLSMVFLLFVFLPWYPSVSWIRGAAAIGLALLLGLAVIAAVVLVYGDRALHVLIRPLGWLPFVSDAALQRAPAHFVRGLAGLLSPRVALVSFAWTTLSWMVLGVGFWLVMEACQLSLSPLAGLLVVIGIGLAMILPSSPAALGVFEGATVVVLSAYGVSDSEALSYAFVLHALNILPLFVVAAAGFTARRLRRSSASGTPLTASLTPSREH